MIKQKEIAELKSLVIDGVADFANEEKHLKNKRAWEQSLSHQRPVSDLPAFDTIYDEMTQFIKILL